MIKAWLAAHWVAGAIFMCGALVLVAPLMPGGPERLIYLAGPLYMFHQVEEHYNDRFRMFVNTYVFHGVEALTLRDVLWINMPGVWGVNLAALYLAHYLGAGWGVAVFYFVLLNGLSHVGATVLLRRYNPGLITSVALFIPFGILGIAVVPASILQSLVGLAVAVLIHLSIIVLVKRNAALAVRHGTA